MTNKNPSTGVAPRSQFHFSDGRCCRMLRLTPARFTGRRESGQFHFSGNGVVQVTSGVAPTVPCDMPVIWNHASFRGADHHSLYGIPLLSI